MRIKDLLKEQCIELNADKNINTKENVIGRLLELMNNSGNIEDIEEYKKGVLQREEHCSTGIGGGIAIPHAKNKAVKTATLSAMVIPEGVDYDALDGEPSKLFFMIAAPEGGGDIHLQVLARLSTILMDEDFKDKLISAKSKKEFLSIIDEKETEKFPEEAKEEKNSSKGGYRVLAVTACPTGIAHTFMAAENLEQKGKKLGISIKVETNGADGAKNVLTKEEIEAAEGIIVAADKNVEMDRFDGKKVIITKVSDGIHKGEELINRAISGDVPIYHSSNKSKESENAEEKEGIGRSIYKHLMNGVSHMLPFVIGGGILIALAFLLDDYSINPANFGKNTPVAAYLLTIGQQAFGLMLPVLAGYIGMSIADRPGLAVGFIGGMVAKMGITFANPAGGDINAGFLGALLAGFIGGYVVLGLKKLFSKLPNAIAGIKPILIYPVLGILIVAIVTTFINPFMGMINTGLTGFLNNMNGSSKILLGIIVAGMQSTDMGGPINKTSYVFATSQLASGNYEIMAAVMAGGMIPPLAIALCTTFFKNRFTEKERKSGVVNYVLGLSFISEGAIPFAAQDPLRVIPACVAGSAVAGGLSMFFGCTLRAPHGGIFVLPLIGNPFGYLISLVIGAIVGCIVLAFLKKPLAVTE
ncbi:PTS system fructose-specific EIIABC component [Clostridium pasteurianum DSM 525 = ATCC 6013]|uniref:PTS system fructose-specific EIIABC component n=1 Tax=Clostridium pasteurianum DSM 525 = ATCC 6013 TaxID=1262449 RepID=A0A0H3J9E3_CLOPA|nr:fructose-specific PTS transporter subunit EIIC [Clostridium pasteurianum]AJA49952.1 PTS system fructose-specific EIIABC component [Clostridium pasteurianum DSM 525 = ATCC 6013]AJA53940.1 PTS system fructose-specific EIIABC component [Clostridium pasteurianum DSM 525 = ATCC 6013]AOZ77086.1 PTS fructose transporter subunit IIC [Clostridium pasteurianum DSM 525 = ATCC 6013]AOZ80883.1 PTS fructose transporter subunit IIC [Clostridium pasteurianum]ELP59336.1 PTS system fructose subfamily transpo